MKRKLSTTEIHEGSNGRNRDRQLRGEIRTLSFVAGIIEDLIRVRKQEQTKLRRGGRHHCAVKEGYRKSKRRD